MIVKLDEPAYQSWFLLTYATELGAERNSFWSTDTKKIRGNPNFGLVLGSKAKETRWVLLSRHKLQRRWTELTVVSFKLV